MKFYYIRFTTNAGPGADFVKTKTHPFHPDFYANWTDMVANKASLVTGVIVKSEQVIVDFLYELPEEVARLRFPKEFEGIDVEARDNDLL